EGGRTRDPDPCPVLVVVAPGVDPMEGVALADHLRQAGVGAEAFPQGTGEGDAVKLARQLKYADARGKALVLLVAPDEQARGVCIVKDMESGTQEEVALADAPMVLARRLAGSSARPRSGP